MTGVHDLGLFIVSGLLLNVTPGADTLYIVGRSTGQGWKAGAVAALGIGAGCLVHTFAAALGLSAILATSANAFTIVKWAGAAYLVGLGITMLRSRPSAVRPDARPAATVALSRAFAQGS
jgi:threonine/homoserine/homoserine lactone efflux protein